MTIDKNEVPAIKVPVCHTCHAGPKSEKALKNWVTECPRCAAHTSGRANKRMAHCALCKKGIVVMNVPADVRLVCSKCFSESGNKKRDDRLWKANREIMRIRGGQRQMGRAREQERALMVAEHAEVIEKLQKELADRPVNDLAARTRAKVAAKYGVSQRELLEGIVAWFWDEDGSLLLAPKISPSEVVEQYLEFLSG